MHKTRTLVFLVSVMGLALASSAQTADEIIAKSLAAQGGVAKLKALSTTRVTGYAESSGARADFMEVKKRPEKLRREMHIQEGVTAIEVYDGQKGWKIDPGKTNVEPVVDDELKSLLEDADFDGPLVDYKQKGHKVELVGKEKVDGADAYNVRVTLKNGKVRNHYFDAQTFLEVRETGTSLEGGKQVPIQISYSDYRDVKGFKVAFHAEHRSQTEQGEVVLKFTITANEFDIPVDDAIFKKPVTAFSPGQ